MLGSSLGSRKLLEGGLDAVLGDLVGVCGKRPQEICEILGGASCECRCSQDEIALTHLLRFAVDTTNKSTNGGAAFK